MDSQPYGAVERGLGGAGGKCVSKYLNVRCGRLLEEYHVKYENRMRHLGREGTLTYVPKEGGNMR